MWTAEQSVGPRLRLLHCFAQLCYAPPCHHLCVALERSGVLAGRQGLEPRYADPESAVLPLDDLPGSEQLILTSAFSHRLRLCRASGGAIRDADTAATAYVLEQQNHPVLLHLRRPRRSTAPAGSVLCTALFEPLDPRG